MVLKYSKIGKYFIIEMKIKLFKPRGEKQKGS